jgi:hypothetical protein
VSHEGNKNILRREYSIEAEGCPLVGGGVVEDSGGDFFRGIDSSVKDSAIKVGKAHFWEIFMKPSILEGFGGGTEVPDAVHRFLAQVGHKKLYIYDRRYGRALQFLKGFSRSE